MADYTVTVRADEDVKTLGEWADDQEREPAKHLNHLIREALRQYRTAANKTPRAMGGTRRGTRDKAA